MATQSWLGRLVAAINAEYERRIRRASLVTEYGAHQHEEEDDDDDGAVIVNVPRGAAVPRHPPTPPAE